jgi:integrase
MSDQSFPLISKKNRKALEHFPPLYFNEYRTFKQDFIDWLEAEGKNPLKGIGYSENTIKQTHYKIEEVLRWIWERDDEFTTKIPEDTADEFITEHMTEYSDNPLLDFIKSIKRFYEYKNQTKDALHDWEYEHKDELSPNPEGNRTIDYFKKHEMEAIYKAAIELGSIRSYDNKHMTDQERDQISAHLAQRFEKPKSEIGPEDFDRANSWLMPSIISTCIDVGLRPIEVGRAKVQWVNIQDNSIIIPARESTKNDEPWECKISNKTAMALKNWIEEREQYEKYDGRDNLWLTTHGNPYSSTSLNPMLDKLTDEAGIEEHGRKLSWYSLRRGCATMWTSKATIADAQAQLRHIEMKTTLTYTSSPDEKRGDIANDLW